jgi:hypothetical protein
MWPYAVAIALIMVWLAYQRTAGRDLWVIIPFLLFGLTSQRALFLASIVLVPWVLASAKGSAKPPMSSTLPAPLLALVALSIIILPVVLHPSEARLDESVFPISALGSVADGPLFHDDGVGGYLILADEDRPVLVDDRAELYGREFFDEVIAAKSGGPAWRGLFKTYGIHQALVRSEDGISDALLEDGWVMAYRDDDFHLLVAP